MIQYAPAKSGLYIEFHGWPEGSPSYPGGVVDVTQFVMSLRWSEGTTAPWGGMSLSLAVPFNLLPDIFPGRRVPVKQTSWGADGDSRLNPKAGDVISHAPRYGQVPETGFWIVVGHHDDEGKKRVYYLARCHRIRLSVISGHDGLVETQPVQVEAENFFTFLNRSRMQFAPTGGEPWGEEGFVWDLNSWNAGLQTLIESLLTEPLGSLFAKLWQQIVKVALPPSLGGSNDNTLGDQVFIGWNDATVDADREGAAVPVFGFSLRMAGPLPDSPSILSFFTRIFGADPRAVELFPCVEYRGRESTDLYGSSLAVIYRMKPLLNRAITAANVGADNGKPLRNPTASTKAGLFQTANVVDKEKSIGEWWYEFGKSDIESIDFLWSDDDRVNLTYSSNFSSDLGPMGYGLTGTPLIRDVEQVRRHGLRVSELQWPFYPPSLQDASAQIKGLMPDRALQVAKDALASATHAAKDATKEAVQAQQELAALIVDEDAALADVTKATKRAADLGAVASSAAASAANLAAAASSPATALAIAQSLKTLTESAANTLAAATKAGEDAAGSLQLQPAAAAKVAMAVVVATTAGAEQAAAVTKAAIASANAAAAQAAASNPAVVARTVAAVAAVQSSVIDLKDYADALTELCWALAGESERFCRGAVRTYFRPYIKPGHWGRFYMHDMCLTGYIESVSHDVGVMQDDGLIVTGTTVVFSRGTLRYYDGSPAAPPEYQTPLMTKEANPSGKPALFDAGPVQAPVQIGTAGTTTKGANVYGAVEQQQPDTNTFKIFKPSGSL